MKKWYLVPLALLCITLTACTTKEPAGDIVRTAEPALTAAQLAEAVVESQKDVVTLTALPEEELSDHLKLMWGMEETWLDAAVYTASGMDGREIGVVRLSREADASAAAEALEEYRQSRLADFFGYAPQQAELLENAAVLTKGDHLVFLACADVETAKAALEAALNGGPHPAPTAQAVTTPEPTPEAVPAIAIDDFIPFDPPNDADMTLYDTAAILDAWESGDMTGLSDKDAAILTRCKEIMTELVKNGMSDFEKELALHDWLIEWGSYDQSANNTPDHSGQPDNNNPYGMLIGGYGICLGYATTFQLLMDLAGVECITVVGASSNSTGDHAWNQVKLDGEWYCVDPTWDDPTVDWGGRQPDKELMIQFSHRYFNVTSAEMRDTNHQWDYVKVPEATATAYRWNGVNFQAN